jgi:hypothetical protein
MKKYSKEEIIKIVEKFFSDEWYKEYMKDKRIIKFWLTEKNQEEINKIFQEELKKLNS